MISERILELINADVDGELRPEDQSELDAALESSAEARAMKSELAANSVTPVAVPTRERRVLVPPEQPGE